MILDNADDPTIFSDTSKDEVTSDNSDLIVSRPVSLSTYRPQTPNGSILVTSRSEDAAFRLTGSHNDIVKVEPMDEDSALLLFGKKLRDGFHKDDGIELLQALEYMPLAISQAAAYINQRAPRITVARYPHDFRKNDRNRANLLNMDAGELRRDSKASNSIIATWQISFGYIRGKRPSAARLLSLMSFFDRQGIPEFLLHSYDDGEDDSDISQKDTKDMDLEDDVDTEFEEDVFTLRDYSLITTNIRGDQFEMHRLVQFSTRKWFELNKELEKWTKKYIRILSKAFPNGKYESWTTCRVLFPHAEVLLAYRPIEMKYLIYWSETHDNAGWYAREQGKYEAAEKMHRRALEGYEKALGEDHPDTLTRVNNLAAVLQGQGKYKAAEAMHRPVLGGGYKKALGDEHPYTLTSVYCLAYLLRQYKDAKALYERSYAGFQKVLGINHPKTLNCFKHYSSMVEEMNASRDPGV